jgi:glycosyltransferase involved in cell wall biosynthesis
MRVLSLHNRYQLQGGEDIVVMREAEMLRAFGVPVDVFEITNDAITTLREKIKTIVHVGYSSDMRDQVRQRIRSFKADVVHVHNFFPRFTPAVYDAARDEGCGIVQTLHNYRLMCAGGLLFRDGQICTDCLTKESRFPGLSHRCYRKSLVGTAALTGMVALHSMLGTWRDKVGCYIVLTEFARSLFVANLGIPADRVIVKPNVVPDLGTAHEEKGYALFVGRLSSEKGVTSILRAVETGTLPLPVKIVGTGPMEPAVRTTAEAMGGDLEFLGAKSNDEVHRLLRGARMLLAPSVWHEAGVPLVIGEAFSAGVPVITTRLQPMESIVEDGRNGLLVTPESEADICAAVTRLTSDDRLHAAMSIDARRSYEKHYSPSCNQPALMQPITAIA